MAYVYKHIRKDNGEVFYVGLSLKNDPKHGRAYSRGDRRNNYWRNIINTTEYEVHIIEDNLTAEEAIEREKHYIALYGRKDLGLGTLCNFTDGGDGGMLGYRHTEEHKKNASERQLGELNHNYGKFGELSPTFGRKATQEQRDHLSKMRKGKRLGEENHRFGKKASDETRLKQSLARKGKRTGAEDPKSQLVLDKETGIFYVSIREAYYTIGFKCSEKHFQAMLRGDYTNKTSCVKV